MAPGATSKTRLVPPPLRITPGAAEASIVTFREIRSSLFRVIVWPARAGAKVIGVPCEALAIACRSEPGPLSAVLVTMSGWLSTAPMSIAAPSTRASPLWSVDGRLAVMVGTPSLL